MTPRTYQTPAAFKTALEQRLKASAPDGALLNRRRQLLVFDRFLARITRIMGDAVVLKGGLVLELRLERARATKDIDLSMRGSADEALDKLQEAGALELGDFMTFIVRPDDNLPEMTGDGIVYQGYRFRAECQIAGKVYGQSFGIDIAYGDPLVGKPDLVIAEDKLNFAGIAPPTLKLYPVVSHVAEKFHAYTMPRARPNSRVKDFPDIALLAGSKALEGALLRDALNKTFEARGTHPLPSSVRDPPPGWEAPYAAMAKRDSLPWTTLNELLAAVQAFLNPVLGSQSGTWNAARWQWDGGNG